VHLFCCDLLIQLPDDSFSMMLKNYVCVLLLYIPTIIFAEAIKNINTIIFWKKPDASFSMVLVQILDYDVLYLIAEL
jgi:hypothetical protein